MNDGFQRGSRGRRFPRSRGYTRSMAGRRRVRPVDEVAHSGDYNQSQQCRRRHPPHLKGREIGLWYSRNSESRQAAEENIPNLVMDEERATSIDQIISAFSSRNGESSSNDWSSNIGQLASQMFESSATETESNSSDDVNIVNKINSIQDSTFKSMYVKNIQGNQRKMVHNSGDDIKVRNVNFTKSAFIDEERAKEQSHKLRSEKYQEMLRFRMKLPSYNMREEILSVINNNQCVVLSGETGCGKTTQVPQFLLDDVLEKKEASTCRIICTQPRRISAISVAKRVADERAEELGLNVGYQIRLEKVLPRDVGSILYCTTGVVLQWLQTDTYLSTVSHLIIDEVHERDSLSDFLICVAKQLLPYRPDLKVILMSATLNADKFSQYYGDCPKIHIPGCTFSVVQYYLEDVIEKLRFEYNQVPYRKLPNDPSFQKVQDGIIDIKRSGKYSSSTINELMHEESEMINYDLIVQLLRHIDQLPPGAILVFVPGWEQISGINKLLEEDSRLGFGRTLIIPLHSMMPTVNQREVFDRPPQGVRKIVLATNIAETSITIDDIVYVIDCGKIKMKSYNKNDNVATLQSEWVTWANAKQRKGRAGRVQEGICYHLFSRARGSLLDDYPLPEIQRTRLEEVILNVKILQLGSSAQFLSKIMEPPDFEVIQISLQLLTSISALDSRENLTPLGYHLALLPVDPFIGKMLLTGALFSCLDPILTIAASLTFKDPFIIPLNMESEVDKCKRRLDNQNKSDHILLVTIYSMWDNAEQHGQGQRCARQNFLSSSVMYQLRKLRTEFMNILRNHNFVNTTNPYARDVNRNSDNNSLIKAVITAGLYPNVARIVMRRNGRAKYFNTAGGQVYIHPKSVNAEEKYFQSHWLVYWLKMRTTKVFLYDTTMVNNYAVLFFGKQLNYDEESHCISVDNFIKVKCDKKTYAVMQKLRDELDALIEHKISHPSVTNWDPSTKEGCLLKLIINLLSEEK